MPGPVRWERPGTQALPPRGPCQELRPVDCGLPILTLRVKSLTMGLSGSTNSQRQEASWCWGRWSRAAATWAGQCSGAGRHHTNCVQATAVALIHAGSQLPAADNDGSTVDLRFSCPVWAKTQILPFTDIPRRTRRPVPSLQPPPRSRIHGPWRGCQVVDGRGDQSACIMENHGDLPLVCSGAGRQQCQHGAVALAVQRGNLAVFKQGNNPGVYV